jgi:hypothetical protein
MRIQVSRRVDHAFAQRELRRVCRVRGKHALRVPLAKRRRRCGRWQLSRLERAAPDDGAWSHRHGIRRTPTMLD